MGGLCAWWSRLARWRSFGVIWKTLPRWDNPMSVHDFVKYLRANPQLFALLIVCLVLGLGTFLVVMYGLISSGSTTTTGEPEGLIAALRLLAI